MANSFGQGIPLLAIPSAATRTPEVTRPVALPPPPPSETDGDLASVVAAIATSGGAATAAVLKASLAMPIERLQRALQEGLRAGRLRRMGTRRNLAYVVNE